MIAVGAQRYCNEPRQTATQGICEAGFTCAGGMRVLMVLMIRHHRKNQKIPQQKIMKHGKTDISYSYETIIYPMCIIEALFGLVKEMEEEENVGWELAQRICEAEVRAGIRRFCSKCGRELKQGSLNYFEGFHVDGCD